MLEQLYEWIRSIAYFMVFSAVLTHVIPGQAYRKYIRFFTGLLLVLLLLHPVMEMLGMERNFSRCTGELLTKKSSGRSGRQALTWKI